MVEKIQLFPSNSRISCATPTAQRKNPTNSFSIPIVGICYRWKTSDKKPQPFSKKTPDPPAGPALVDLQKAAHLLAGDHASIYYLSVALLSLPPAVAGLCFVSYSRHRVLTRGVSVPAVCTMNR